MEVSVEEPVGCSTVGKMALICLWHHLYIEVPVQSFLNAMLYSLGKQVCTFLFTKRGAMLKNAKHSYQHELL